MVLNQLVTNDFYDLVVRETNKYAADLYINRSSEQSRFSSWVDIDVEELKIFFWTYFSFWDYTNVKNRRLIENK